MPPYNYTPCIFIAIAGLFIILQQFELFRSWFLAGWLFGFGYFVSGLWWIGNALLVEGNPYQWAYPFAVVGLPSLLAFFPCVFIGIAKIAGDKLAARLPAQIHNIGFYTFIGALFLAEMARSHLFTGFPWNQYGMAWMEWPLVQSVHFIGINGLTLFTIWCAALLGSAAFHWIKGYRIEPVLTITVLVVALTVLNIKFADILEEHATQYNEDVIIHLVQPNIPQSVKWDPANLGSNLEKSITVTRNAIPLEGSKATKRLIIWPETTLSYPVLDHPKGQELLKNLIKTYKQDAYLVSGVLRREDENYFNSLQVFDSDLKIVDSFDKFHLVPFGEYIPFQKYIPLAPIVQFSGFVAGPGPQTLSVKDIPPFSPLVCYEIIFSGNAIANSDPKAQWIVNVTNDAWYGVSPGPVQHLAQARLRAIEEGLPVIRSANTGISAVIDSYGRIVGSGALNTDFSQEIYLPKPRG